MSLLKISVTLLLFLINKLGNAQDELISPCPRLFVYEGKSNEADRWYGIVTLLSETDLQGVWLRLIFDRPSLQLGNWFGEVVTTDNKEYLVKNRNVQLKAHVPQTIRFYLRYNPNQPAPKLMSFRLNARTVCPEGLASDSAPPVMVLQTSNALGADAVTPNPGSSSGGGGGGGGGGSRPSGGSFPWNQGSSSSSEDGFYPGDFNLGNNRPLDISPVENADLNAICGTVITNPRPKRQTQTYYYTYPENQNYYQNQYTRNRYQNRNRYPYYNYYDYMAENQGLSDRVLSYINNIAQPRPLITYGQPTVEGEYPWHAALYHVRGIDLAYICGASLISKDHILTVAHCVTIIKSQRPLKPENLIVYLGKYYLKRFSSPGVQDRTVAEIIPHPQYNPQIYSNDIAVVKMSTPIDITDYVRPVCLWRGSADTSSIVNKEGSVVGWGFDETGKVTEQLMQAKMPVVSLDTCLFSFPDFYSRFTSSTTYCAGFRNGTSVCNGDSGGGMVFPLADGNNRKTRWQIRGLVSISVALQNQFKCDASHYVVFTDSAKYLDWIKKVMGK